MRRWIALNAEIAGSGDDAAAEMMLPQAIDCHACRQRVIGRGQPLSKHGASSRSLGVHLLFGNLRFAIIDGRRETGRNFFGRAP